MSPKAGGWNLAFISVKDQALRKACNKNQVLDPRFHKLFFMLLERNRYSPGLCLRQKNVDFSLRRPGIESAPQLRVVKDWGKLFISLSFISSSVNWV